MAVAPIKSGNETVVAFLKRELESRMEEAERIRTHYPDRLPLIVTASSTRVSFRALLGARPLPDLDKFKYLVPTDFTVGQLVYVIRKRMRLPSEVALFLYSGAQLPSSTTVIQELYGSSKNVDGFLCKYFIFQTKWPTIKTTRMFHDNAIATKC